MSGWQPIETAPSSQDVLLFSPDSTVPAWIGHHFPPDPIDLWYPQETSTFHGAPSDVPPTHWMPLPEPPAAPGERPSKGRAA